MKNWTIITGKLQRTFNMSDFAAGVDFINAVALAAKELCHHPDVLLSYNKVTITLWTHDSQSITALDYALAQKIDSIYSD